MNGELSLSRKPEEDWFQERLPDDPASPSFFDNQIDEYGLDSPFHREFIKAGSRSALEPVSALKLTQLRLSTCSAESSPPETRTKEGRRFNQSSYKAETFPKTTVQEHRINKDSKQCDLESLIRTHVATNTESDVFLPRAGVEIKLHEVIERVRNIQQHLSSIVAKHFVIIAKIDGPEEQLAAQKNLLNSETMKIYYRQVPEALKEVTKLLKGAGSLNDAHSATFRRAHSPHLNGVKTRLLSGYGCKDVTTTCSNVYGSKKIESSQNTDSECYNEVKSNVDKNNELPQITEPPGGIFFVEMKSKKRLIADPKLVLQAATENRKIHIDGVSAKGLDLKLTFFKKRDRDSVLGIFREFCYEGHPLRSMYDLTLDARSNNVYVTVPFSAHLFDQLPFRHGDGIDVQIAAQILADRNRDWFISPEDIIHVRSIPPDDRHSGYVLTLFVSNEANERIQKTLNTGARLDTSIRPLAIHEPYNGDACYRCHTPGHYASSCTSEIRCSHCIDLHESRRCPAKRQGKADVCYRCHQYNESLRSDQKHLVEKVNHVASSALCPTVRMVRKRGGSSRRNEPQNKRFAGRRTNY